MFSIGMINKKEPYWKCLLKNVNYKIKFKTMNKEIRIVFTPSEMENIEKARKYFKEKTKTKTLVRIIEDFIRINHL